MKRRIITRLIFVAIALALSLFVSTRDGLRNVSPCEMTPGCVTTPNSRVVGTFITTRHGFPVPYKEVQTFQPTQGAQYKEASLTQNNTDIAAIMLDVLFWFSLLELLWRIRTATINTLRPTALEDKAAAPHADKVSRKNK